ncbi:prepilin-type N-terminal cleavage/methylation domain-containing protein [Xylanimonas ulmi]|uniref:Prepilin-type N-terminal cleavage/methylation domain-containing protein n=1 Tax=Xylanimonas ulmi TaxID=228973 RepID=A0A4Q7M250_9MICO|nr:hypothetical protein [Xylanibacterium ulmi]RZS61524.1 hypothetical protein EV386_1828 [Xylanibacterium ulmi]
MTARARQREAGVTLAELVVVMMVGSVVLALVGALTVGLLRSNARNLARQEQVDAARTGVSWLSRSLERAVAPSAVSDRLTGDLAILAASDTELRFYALLDDGGSDVEATGPSLVTFAVLDGALHRIVRRPDPSPTGDWTFTCGATQCPDLHEDLVVARGVTGAVFRYVDRAGGRLPADASARTLTEAERAAVASVEVSIVIADPADPGATTTVLARVSLLDYWSEL